ncbi:MAG: DUF2066 domain-containing protein [Pseudomonadota bacterium]
MNHKVCCYFLGLLLILSIFWCSTGVAVTSLPIYSVQVPVQSMSETERNKALPDALKTVLIRVSGDASVSQNDQIAGMLNIPNRYVSEYSYQKAVLGAAMPWILVVNFTPSAINQMLTQQKFSIWSKERPLMLIWLAIKNAKGTELVAGDSTDDAVRLIKQKAERRGLPIAFPLLDFSDMRHVSASDLWAQSIDTVKQASLRYSPDEILMVNIDETNTAAMTAQWLLLSQDQKTPWTTDGAALNDVIESGINKVADALAQQFVGANTTGQENTVQLIVMNLQDVGDYAKVMQYLKGLSGVMQVSIENVSMSQVEFNLMLTTSTQALQHTIQLDKKLQPIQDQELGGQDSSVLKFRYQEGLS